MSLEVGGNRSTWREKDATENLMWLLFPAVEHGFCFLCQSLLCDINYVSLMEGSMRLTTRATNPYSKDK